MKVAFEDQDIKYTDIKKRIEESKDSKKTNSLKIRNLSDDSAPIIKLNVFKKLSLSKLVIFLAVLILILSISFVVFSLSKDDLTKEEEALQVIEKLSDIFTLPNTNPTFATIVDVESLKNENAEFYKDAKDGDRLLIFKDEKLAIIYRDKENKIIKIGFVNFENQDSLETVEE